jgi:outer membrane protein assembly factor BamB
MPSRRSFLTTSAGLASTGLAATAGCLGDAGTFPEPGADAETDWPMANRDKFATAYAPDAKAPRSAPSERFAVDLDGTPVARPTVVGSTVFQPTWDGLTAVDAENGERRWRYTDGGDDWGVAVYTPPAVYDGVAYVGSERGLFALDVDSGEEQWRIETEGEIQRPPVADHLTDGEWDALYVATDAGEVLRVRLDGTVDWRTTVYGRPTRLVSDHPSTVTVGTYGGEVFDLYEGRGTWRQKVPGAVTAMSATQGNTLYVATFGGGVLKLRTAAHAGRVDWHAEDGPIAEGSLVHAGDGLFGADGAGLTRHDEDDGAESWTVDD